MIFRRDYNTLRYATQGFVIKFAWRLYCYETWLYGRNNGDAVYFLTFFCGPPFIRAVLSNLVAIRHMLRPTILMWRQKHSLKWLYICRERSYLLAYFYPYLTNLVPAKPLKPQMWQQEEFRGIALHYRIKEIRRLRWIFCFDKIWKSISVFRIQWNNVFFVPDPVPASHHWGCQDIGGGDLQEDVYPLLWLCTKSQRKKCRNSQRG